MALSKVTSAEDRTRFVRLGLVIIEELTPVLRDVLTNEILPSLILNAVQQKKSLLNIIRQDQMDKIHNAQTQGYQDFDINLLYTLLRNLCPNIQKPTKGWGISEMPDQGETNLGDDIERIRLIRNTVIGHSSVASLSETQFKEYWSTISDICNRMQTRLGNSFRYVQRLQNAEERTIDSATEEMYTNKMKELIEDDKSTRELIQDVKRFMEETVRIETRNPGKRKLAEALTESNVYILNSMVDSIRENTSESSLEQLYESIEDFIREENVESSRLASDPFFSDLTHKIEAYANLREENKMNILARFFRFTMKLKRNYTASLESSNGSLLLKLTFTSERGYNLYRQDLESGEIGKQILEVLLFPPYLANFDLEPEDLVVYLNDEKLTQENGEDPFKDVVPSPNQATGKQTCIKHENQHPILFCQQCQVPVCVDCITSPEHKDHCFTNIHEAFPEKLKQINEKLTQGLIKKNIISTNLEKMVSDVNKICSTLHSKSRHLHRLLDSVLQSKLAEIENYKRSMTDFARDDLKCVDAYISDLMKKLNEIANQQLPEEMMIDLNDYHLETIEMDFPDLTEEEINSLDIENLFGTLTIPNTCIRQSESGIDLNTESDEEEAEELDEPEEPQVVSATSFTLPSMASHVSSVSSEKAWVSDFDGNLYLTDDIGSILQRRKTLSGGLGVHTISKDGDLIYIDQNKKIKKVSKENEVEDLDILIPKSWNPCCIYSCHSNRDLLIGMWKRESLDQKAMLKRYTTSGEERWFKDENQVIYEYPQYITENRNLDVIVTDFYKAALVVTNHKGDFRFNYSGHPVEEEFEPNGISTDSQAHILVSDLVTNSVQVISEDGDFLFFLLTKIDVVEKPFSLNFNQKDNFLWVGLLSSPRMLVYSIQYENDQK